MYLSRLMLNPRSRQVRNELSDPYEMHRTIMRAFPAQLPADERVLFRLEVHPRTGIPSLLVQSVYAPDWGFLAAPEKNYLLAQSYLPTGIAENPSVKRVQLRLRLGQTLIFRLRANPTVKKKREGKKQGRRVGIYHEDEQLAWLQRKLNAAGAQVTEARVAQQNRQKGKRLSRHKHELAFLTVQFEGILVVQDPATLQQAVREGIGPAKAFGCGLLSLAPA